VDGRKLTMPDEAVSQRGLPTQSGKTHSTRLDSIGVHAGCRMLRPAVPRYYRSIALRLEDGIQHFKVEYPRAEDQITPTHIAQEQQHRRLDVHFITRWPTTYENERDETKGCKAHTSNPCDVRGTDPVDREDGGEHNVQLMKT